MQVTYQVEETYQAQVTVVGGGPAGVCAAIAAARNGAKTLLIENGGCLGGMATLGGVNPFMTCYDKDGNHMIIRGMFEEIVDRLVVRGGALHPAGIPAGQAFSSYIVVGHNHVTPFDAEILKVVLDEMCTEAGVKVLFHTAYVSSVMDGNALKGLIVMNKAGLQMVNTNLVIDATGDGDVAYRSGVPCEMGDEAGGRIQPASMFFRIGNVDTDKVDEDIEKNRDNFYRKDGVNYRSLHWRVSEAREKGDWNMKRVSIGLFRGVKKDEFHINTSRIMGVDATDPESLSAAEMEGRRQVQHIYHFLKKYVPGCENAVLMGTPATVGIRESRHIRGEYQLKTEDILGAFVPEDSVFIASNSVDVHGRFGPLSNEYVPIENGQYYGFPYRSLVPLGVENLLVAGRCISATSEAAGAVRVMPPCMAMGQAAGTAAALAIAENSNVRSLDTKKLISILKEQGVCLGIDE